MVYEINVSLNGKHFFATSKRSITDEKTLHEIVAVFKVKFPESEGYKITAVKYATYGTDVEI